MWEQLHASELREQQKDNELHASEMREQQKDLLKEGKEIAITAPQRRRRELVPC